MFFLWISQKIIFLNECYIWTIKPINTLASVAIVNFRILIIVSIRVLISSCVLPFAILESALPFEWLSRNCSVYWYSYIALKCFFIRKRSICSSPNDIRIHLSIDWDSNIWTALLETFLEKGQLPAYIDSSISSIRQVLLTLQLFLRIHALP